MKLTPQNPSGVKIRFPPWATRGSPGMHPQHASRAVRSSDGKSGMEHMPITRQTRTHHDRRTGPPCQATQCVYPYRPLTKAPRPLCQHCRRVGLPSELPEADAVGEVHDPANE